MECQVEKNKIRCNCSAEKCPRRGKCCECIVYHFEKEQLPACVFPKDVEVTFDRSIAKFIEVYQGKGGKKL